MRIAALALLLAALAGCGGAEPPRADVLVFSRTTAFRHGDAIDAGRAALRERFGAELTEDASRLEDLEGVAVVVLLQTNGTVLDAGQRTAFERWVRAGGSVVAIHAAANAERDWPFYAELLGGARFRNHPPGAAQLQRATVTVTDREHPATAGLPRRWTITDELYNFEPEPRARVLATLDEREYDEFDGTAGADPHPIAWWTRVGAGRSFYTALGHGGDAWADARYRRHVFGAIEWAGG